jgi:cytochrome c oxidase assembly protein Cox11
VTLSYTFFPTTSKEAKAAPVKDHKAATAGD